MSVARVGKKAPDFTMATALGDGQSFGTVSLADYQGFKDLNCEVLGVSTDSVHAHRAWLNTPRERNGLGLLHYPLASDIHKTVARDYGVLIEEEGIALRGLFIIDPHGELKYSVVTHNDVGRSVEETIRVLQALQSGGLCPINWKPGTKHLVSK